MVTWEDFIAEDQLSIENNLKDAPVYQKHMKGATKDVVGNAD